jgi:hypothetical protein
VKLGLSPIEAIRAATLTGAELMGWQSSVGSIEKGKFGNDDAVRYARSNSGQDYPDGSVLSLVTWIERDKDSHSEENLIPAQTTCEGDTFIQIKKGRRQSGHCAEEHAY